LLYVEHLVLAAVTEQTIREVEVAEKLLAYIRKKDKTTETEML
jgi:hypothetical protein